MSAFRNYDAWITREPDCPDDEPFEAHCSGCGAFLAAAADEMSNHDELAHCDGQTITVTGTYDADADAGLLAILGDEFAGKSYEVEYDPPCGQVGEHDPHDWPIGGWTELIRVCRRCRHRNVEQMA